MRLIANLLVLALVFGSFQACVSKKKYDELAAAKEQTDQALAETQQQVKDLEANQQQMQDDHASEKDQLNSDMQSMRDDLEDTKSQVAQLTEKLNMTEEELNALKDEINDMFGTYEDAGLAMDSRDGRLYLMTDPAIQYRSGSTRLSSDERSALQELAGKLKENADLRVIVEGHTDNVPVKEGAAVGDNWNLSVFRAKAVATYLIRQGVNPNQVAISGRGEHMPVGDNSTAEGRQQNRRSVIMPDPDFGKLMEASQGGGN